MDPYAVQKDEPEPVSVETKIIEIGRDLARTFTEVLDAIPGAPHRPQLLSRSLGLNTVLTSRLLKAAQHQDPLAVAHLMPGPEPLRRLLRAAERKKVSSALIREARAAVDRFEQLIDVEAGDRSALDALISGWLPDAREKVELLAKQSVFRGISQLLGTACEAQHCTVVLYPSRSRADRADEVWLVATRGLRRVRPGLTVHYDTLHSAPPVFTVSGAPIEGVAGLLLEEFCSRPVPQLEVTQAGGIAQFTLSGEDVGLRSAVDLVHAAYLPEKKELFRGPGEPPRRTTVAAGIATPCRVFLFDVLLHEDVFPKREPALRIYRTVGVFNRGASRQEGDRLDVIETLQPLGHGLAKFRAAETPRYQDMVRHVCEQRQWDASKLRGYRGRIEYPIYSAEIMLGFELPPASQCDATDSGQSSN